MARGGLYEKGAASRESGTPYRVKTKRRRLVLRLAPAHVQQFLRLGIAWREL